MSETRQYAILGVLGSGGFGTVYLAELRTAAGYKKRVALKLINADVANLAEVTRRTRDEARVLALVRHRSLIHVEGLAQLTTGWAVVLEYVDGVDLETLLGHVGPVPPRPVAQIILEVAGVLHVGLHTPGPDGVPLGLLHRDIKPANIRLTPFGEVKLLDFGTARAEFQEREASTRSMAFGTKGYMAPERLEFHDAPPSDVYSLGVVLFELLSGQRFGQSGGDPVKHAARLERAAATAREVVGDGGEELVALMVEMLAFEPGSRPVPRDVERRAEHIAARLGETSLRDWAEAVVPSLEAMDRPGVDDPLVGTVLDEVPGAPVSGAVVAPASEAPPAADEKPADGFDADELVAVASAVVTKAPRLLRRSWALIAGALLLGALGLALLGGLAWWFTRAPAPPAPIAVCPEGFPNTGDPCAQAALTCTYTVPTSCGDRPLTATCQAGAWSASVEPCPATCPEEAPSEGAPCASVRETCDYSTEQPCGVLPLHATCTEGGAWTTEQETCEAAGATCPADAPTDGAPCAGNQRCTYKVALACGSRTLRASCAKGRWSAPTPSCSEGTGSSKASTAKATVKAEGDVTPQLRSGSGASHAPGSVPPGRYTVWADFGVGLAATDLTLDLKAGDEVTVRCSRMMGRCSKR